MLAHFHFERVLFYSRQNDCLQTELRPLFDSGMFPGTINFAQEVFGVSPDAVNLWIGNEQAVSSMHKDHYENLFYVLTGENVFVLCPPAYAPFLYQAEFDSGTFQQEKSGEYLVKENDGDSRVKWIQGNVEPLVDNKDAVPTNQPTFSLTHPIRVHVKAGEMLHLPALWFHRVAQICETIGINYWYEMQFDSPNWCYFNLLQQLQVVDSTKTDSIEL
jgi:jumonji domain-containing protein 7